MLIGQINSMCLFVYIRRIACTDGEANKANKWNDNQMRGTQTKPENFIKEISGRRNRAMARMYR